MTDSDSFIQEVTEEVRRDRFYALLKRYGWIAALVLIVLIGGAAALEWRKAQERAEAEALGDALLAALERDDGAARADALAALAPEDAQARAVTGFLRAGALAEMGETAQAAQVLDGVATEADLAPILRQIAAFKALTLQTATLPAADRRQGFEALAQPGSPLRLLAEEQLALIDVETGQTQDAIDRFAVIAQDAETSAALQQRARQAIVALGGEPPAL